MGRSYSNRQDASITVFLSLILLIILSLIMTVIEGARQSTARVFAERSLTTAMDSILAEFYGPLMEEYHLLGLDISYGNDICEDSEITERMKDYISYTITPRRGLFETESPRKIYGISLDTVEVKNKTRLMDYQGEIFVHEATEYMKYKEIGNVAEFFLEKASLLEQPKKVSIIYDEKVKLEEQIVVIDEGILALMKYLDGVSTGKKGLLTGKDGKLKTERYFAKKIIFGIPTMESTEINNQGVFDALKNQYIDPSELFIAINNSFERLIVIQRYIRDLEARENTIQKQLEDAKSTLSQLEKTLSELKKNKEANTEALEARINNIKSRISDLEDEAQDIRMDLADYIDEQMSCINTITTNGYEIGSLVSGCLSATEQALNELEQIIIAARNAKPKIISYEETLKRQKEGLDKDIYSNLEEGLEELKRYQLENNEGYDFLRMKDILEKNYEVLKTCEINLNEGYEALAGKEFAKAKDKYNKAYQELLTYKTTGLILNYSSLVIQKEDSPDFLGGIKDLIKKGITGLVIDHNTVSAKELSSDELPSVEALLSGEIEGFSFSGLLKNLKIGNKNTGLDGLFGSFDDYSMASLIGNAVDTMAKRILLTEYIHEHFHGFPFEKNNQKARKPSALNYEREYILIGKYTDKDNLEAVIIKLILIRTLLNFTSILGDKSKWKEAKTIASSMVGFTGLPILVSITQGILMILLALASGLVDTCALLMGKELPILKKRIELGYGDLLLMSRDYIQKKATSYKNEKGFSYNDYLTLFLYLTSQNKLSYRMMDLIQENIKLRYGTGFNFQNCIFGYEAEAIFHIEPLFTTFSFMKEHIKSDFNRDFIVRAEYSY